MGRKWSAAKKAEALAIYAEKGVTAASRETGIPGGTIGSWANRTGVQKAQEESNRKAIRCMRERRTRTLEERRMVLVEKLGELAELGVDWTTEALATGDEFTMRDAVGAFTRAIHDLQLLSGGATARGEHRELAGIEDVKRLRDELTERRERKAAGA